MLNEYKESRRQSIVIGALGTVPTMLESRIKEIGISIKTAQIQKTVLLGTARILRKVLEI